MCLDVGCFFVCVCVLAVALGSSSADSLLILSGIRHLQLDALKGSDRPGYKHTGIWVNVVRVGPFSS